MLRETLAGDLSTKKGCKTPIYLHGYERFAPAADGLTSSCRSTREKQNHPVHRSYTKHNIIIIQTHECYRT